MAERFDAYYDSISCKSTGRHIHADGEFVLASDYAALESNFGKAMAYVEKLEAKLAAIGEPRVCLNCGKPEPCELSTHPNSPCTFDPDYATGVRMWKHERRKIQKILTLLAPTNVICMPGYPRVISESTLNSIQSHREMLHRKALEISNEPLDEKPED